MSYHLTSRVQKLYGVQKPHLSPYVHGDANNHGRYGYASNEGNANRGANKCAKLPKDLLLPAPWFLSPESTA